MTLPALFLGHGSPMNAIAENSYGPQWARLAASLPRPKSILVVSAHWKIPMLAVTAGAHPRTIHDFRGFPRALFDVQYPAPGSDALGARIAALIRPDAITHDADWGLDHGAWSVLVHMFASADIPVVQISLDARLSPAAHFALARRLRPLRDEGVLILGSGNLVHNLGRYQWRDADAAPYDWGVRFETEIRSRIEAGDDARAIDPYAFGEDGRLSAPTDEHFLPLIYVLAQRDKGEAASFPIAGFEGGSISMLAVKVG